LAWTPSPASSTGFATASANCIAATAPSGSTCSGSGDSSGFNASGSTQNQALASIVFKQSRYLAVVLATTEVRAVLALLKCEYWLVGNLLYGAGLRLSDT
jgi:hypothetical protein